MSRRALLIGINQYDSFSSLKGCENDAQGMHNILATNEDGSANFECRTFTTKKNRITRKFLRERIIELFTPDFNGDALFYFSGHGTPTEVGGCLVTQDGELGDIGFPMNDLLLLANKSKAKSVFLILDCCFSGELGNPPNLSSVENNAQLKEGLTILAASRSTQSAIEVDGHGVFTYLLISALLGGAADIRGRVSAASIYGYVEQALGSWDQRPLYKSHADRLPPLRCCIPIISDSLIRTLPKIFEKSSTIVVMNKSFEHTMPEAIKENVDLFNKFKEFRNAGLLKTETNKDLYYTALGSEGVYLTLLGQFYWQLADAGRI